MGAASNAAQYASRPLGSESWAHNLLKQATLAALPGVRL